MKLRTRDTSKRPRTPSDEEEEKIEIDEQQAQASSSKRRHFPVPTPILHPERERSYFLTDKKYRIGTSGYHYTWWHATHSFYANIPEKSEFPHYAAEFDMVELNATFYRSFEDAVFDGWRERASSIRPSFQYVVKAHQFYTHRKRLNVDDAFKTSWNRFWAGVQRLRPHLGPVLFQFHDSFKLNPSDRRKPSNLERLRALGEFLPREGRYVFEFRDASWFCPEVYAVLKQYNFCLAIVEVLGAVGDVQGGGGGARGKKSKLFKWKINFLYMRLLEKLMSSIIRRKINVLSFIFPENGWVPTLHRGQNPLPENYPLECCDWGVYIRFHGSSGKYLGAYGAAEMAKWAERMYTWGSGNEHRNQRTVYAAFNNTDDGVPLPSAIQDATALAAALRQLGAS